MKYNTGTKKIQSEGGATISQRLVDSENSNHMCDCFLRRDRNQMEEVKLSPPYIHNFCVSLINSGVCLLFYSGNTADVSRLFQCVFFLETIWGYMPRKLKYFLYGVRYNTSFMQKYQQCINKTIIKRSMPCG